MGGEVRDRAGTNRTLPDTRQQYFAGDPRNANTPAIDMWQGDSYNHDTQLFFNSAQTLGNGVELYGFGGYGRRRGASAGMWRRPNDDRTVRSIYPDGFLPFIKSDIDDGSLAVGLKGEAPGWTWDLGIGVRRQLVRLRDRQQRKRLDRANARRRRSTPARCALVSPRRRSTCFAK